MTERDPGHIGQTTVMRLIHFCSQIPGLHNRTEERETIRNHILTNDVIMYSLPASISDAASSPLADSAKASCGTAEGALPLPQHQAGYWIGLCILVARPFLQPVRSQIYHSGTFLEKMFCWVIMICYYRTPTFVCSLAHKLFFPVETIVQQFIAHSP